MKASLSADGLRDITEHLRKANEEFAMHYPGETGKRQPEAIALYLNGGYEIIPNYGQYAGVENSVCMKKKITA